MIDQMSDEIQGQQDEEKQLQDSSTIRDISYAVLFIAAVFIISAMETGSYRTPWPVAIIAALAGISIFGYSCYLKSKGR